MAGHCECAGHLFDKHFSQLLGGEMNTKILMRPQKTAHQGRGSPELACVLSPRSHSAAESEWVEENEVYAGSQDQNKTPLRGPSASFNSQRSFFNEGARFVQNFPYISSQTA